MQFHLRSEGGSEELGKILGSAMLLEDRKTMACQAPADARKYAREQAAVKGLPKGPDRITCCIAGIPETDLYKVISPAWSAQVFEKVVLVRS